MNSKKQFHLNRFADKIITLPVSPLRFETQARWNLSAGYFFRCLESTAFTRTDEQAEACNPSKLYRG